MAHAADLPPPTDEAPEAGPSKPTVPSKKADPYANYSTAASLGYIDTEALAQEAANAEREAQSKLGTAGEWETVAVSDPTVQQDQDATSSLAVNHDPDDVREFRLDSGHHSASSSSNKRPVYDPYDDQGYDVDVVLKKTKFKHAKETPEDKETREANERKQQGLNRKAWTGLTVGPDGHTSSKTEPSDETPSTHLDDKVQVPLKQPETMSVKPEPEVVKEEDIKPSAVTGMFKKRKGPANRNTRAK